MNIGFYGSNQTWSCSWVSYHHFQILCVDVSLIFIIFLFKSCFLSFSKGLIEKKGYTTFFKYIDMSQLEVRDHLIHIHPYDKIRVMRWKSSGALVSQCIPNSELTSLWMTLQQSWSLIFSKFLTFLNECRIDFSNMLWTTLRIMEYFFQISKW